MVHIRNNPELGALSEPRFSFKQARKSVETGSHSVTMRTRVHENLGN